MTPQELWNYYWPWVSKRVVLQDLREMDDQRRQALHKAEVRRKQRKEAMEERNQAVIESREKTKELRRLRDEVSELRANNRRQAKAIAELEERLCAS